MIVEKSGHGIVGSLVKMQQIPLKIPHILQSFEVRYLKVCCEGEERHILNELFFITMKPCIPACTGQGEAVWVRGPQVNSILTKC